MTVRERFLRGLAHQLGRPEGLRGRAIASLLDRGNRRMVSAAVDAVEAAPGQVVADVGFGGGAGLRLLLDRVFPGGTVHGVEVSATMLDRARRRARRGSAAASLRLHPGRLEELPLPDASLDAVVSANTIYFVDDLDAAFAELARVLRPDGRLALAIGDPDAMTALPFTRHGFVLRPVGDLTERLTRAGFRVDVRQLGAGRATAFILVGLRGR